MKLAEYLKANESILKPATLAFLLKDKDQILLAMKRRGFGVGKWNGVGGKVSGEESIEDAIRRETEEEINVKILEMEEVAVLDFHWIGNKGQQVIVFKVTRWDGEPSESEEMTPKWYSYDQIPYDQMWPDDFYWIPLMLEGKKIKGAFLFSEENEMLDYNLEVVE